MTVSNRTHIEILLQEIHLKQENHSTNKPPTPTSYSEITRTFRQSIHENTTNKPYISGIALELTWERTHVAPGIQTLGRRTHGHRSLDYHRMTAVFSTAGHLTKYVLLDKSLQIFFFFQIWRHMIVFTCILQSTLSYTLRWWTYVYEDYASKALSLCSTRKKWFQQSC